MEPTQTSKELKIPRYTRNIPWLGGAVFGRSPRREETPARHDFKGLLWLLLLGTAMLTIFVWRDILGAWNSIGAGISMVVLCGVWLKRFSATTLPLLRYAAFAITAIQLTILLFVDILPLISR